MKALIALSIIMASASSSASMTYSQKQDITCDAIATAISDNARENGTGIRDAMKIYDGAKVLCRQSYDQASADYSRKKAKAAAVKIAGEAGGIVVELAYDGYAEDNK